MNSKVPYISQREYQEMIDALPPERLVRIGPNGVELVEDEPGEPRPIAWQPAATRSYHRRGGRRTYGNGGIQ